MIKNRTSGRVKEPGQRSVGILNFGRTGGNGAESAIALLSTNSSPGLRSTRASAARKALVPIPAAPAQPISSQGFPVSPISVFACEPQPIVIEGLRKVLEDCEDLKFA